MTEQTENVALLRQAAGRLDELAAKATHNLCPDWVHAAVRHIARNVEIDCGHDDAPDVERPGGIDHGGWSRYDDAPWIAAMGPQVAAPIAAWLRAEADCFENTPAGTRALTDLADAVTGEKWGVRALLSTETQAVAVARAILGEVPA